MTWTLMGRFFGVPLLIIGTIVAGAVLVVLFFGGPAAPQQRTLESLLLTLESNSGERSAGVLLPREKELWQTALELSERLQKKDTELTEGELHLVARRLATMIDAELANIDNITAFDKDLAVQQNLRSSRFDFLMRALARTGCPEAVPALVKVVESKREPYVALAIQQLGNLSSLVSSRESIESILETLSRSTLNETLLTACTTLSVLAPAGDMRVINALTSVLAANDGEVGWAAAIALARLGSTAGKSTLLDLLDRKFLESGEWYRVVDASGTVRTHPLPPERVKALLSAAIDAASCLEDPDLWSMIDRLKSDASPAIKGKAMEVTDRRSRQPASGENG
jgi:hypothetical protein